MTHFIKLLCAILGITMPAGAQIKLRLQSDDVLETGFLTTSNANNLINGLNATATVPLNPSRGGTGLISYATGDLIYANGPFSLARLPAAQGILSGGGTPAWINTSLALSNVLGDETGGAGGGKLMFSNAPTLVNNGAMGAGVHFDGNLTASRVFLGMSLGSDTTFRLYSFHQGTNALSVNLTNGATTFSGPITASAASPQVAGTFIGNISVVNNSPTPEVAADFTNTVDANMQVIVTGVGAPTKFSTIGPSTDTQFQIRQDNNSRIVLEVDDSVTLTNPEVQNMVLSFTDANHAIVGRNNNTTGFANHYHAFGGTLANTAGHRFFTGGTKAAQTPKLEIADDGIKVSTPISFNSFPNALATRENLGRITKFKTSDTARINNTASADPDLQFPVASDQLWSVKLFLKVNVGHANPDLRFGFGLPSVSYKYETGWAHQNLALLYFELSDPGVNSGSGLFAVDMGGAGTFVVKCEVMFLASAAGTFSFNWAQFNTDGANSTKVMAGSYLIAERLN